MGRIKNRLLAKIFTRFPFLLRGYFQRRGLRGDSEIPWTPLKKDLRDCKVAIVTTAGVHLKSQQPFDMKDKKGDPSFREIPANIPTSELMITHDYYDHKDADKDINIVFPIDRLKEMKNAGEIKAVADVNIGFMGHIDDQLLSVLINETAPEAGKRLKAQGVDVVLLTPG
ncbi:MAG: glycine/sarcosine/betaine reductase selenoprotein B family protein [Nitrospirota bacterium]|jgi:D-proline reductase (dithiol) PrdB